MPTWMLKLKGLCAPEDASATATTTPPADAPPLVDPALTTPAPTEKTFRGKDSVVPMTRESLAKAARENEEKGRRAAKAEIESLKAKQVELEAQIKKLQARPASNGNGAAKPKNGQQQTQQQAKNEPQPNNTRRADRREREVKERLDREKRERIKAQRRAEEAQQEAWAAEAHGSLARTAIKIGIKDEDYAIELLTRDLREKRASLSDVEYQKYEKEFDEAKFFEGLKTSRPHLFQETIVPATTGVVPDGNAPPPPGSAQVTQNAANGAQKKATEMTREEYHKDLRRRGLKPPSL